MKISGFCKCLMYKLQGTSTNNVQNEPVIINVRSKYMYEFNISLVCMFLSMN